MKIKFISLMLFLFMPFSSGTAQQALTKADSARWGSYWWHSKDMFDNLPDTRDEIIFLGNSITDGAEWFEIFNNKRCKNRGISGDVTEGILLRLDGIIKCKPSKIFLMIGVNDLSRGIPEEEILTNIEKILGRIRSESPGTVVYIESILPVNPCYNLFPNHTDKTEKIKSVNKSLFELALKTGYGYIDLFDLLCDNNDLLRKDLSVDGLHLNYAGYKIWADAIKPMLKK